MDGRKGGLLLTLIIVAMMLSVLFVFSDSEESSALPEDIGTTGLQWEIDSGTLKITGEGEMPDYDMSGASLPPWFSQLNSVTSIEIGDGVTSLGTDNFTGMPNLHTVRIGLGLTNISPTSFDLTFVDHEIVVMSVTAENVKGKEYTVQGGVNLQVTAYSVVFDSKGGTLVDTIYVDHGNSVPLPPTSPIKGGYYLSDWCTDEGCTNPYPDTGITSLLTLYAKWEIDTYLINYDLQCTDATFDTDKNSYTIESLDIVLDNPSRTGYTFNGWFDAPTGGNHITQIDSGSYGIVNLYAQWTENPAPPAPPTLYSVKFYSEGTLVQTSSLSVGDVIVAPVDPSKASETKYEYTFKEWNGFTTGMLMTAGDKRFDAVFVKSANVGYDAVREEYTATVDEDSAFITKAKIDEIIDKAKNDSDTTMVLKAGEYSVRFDNDALRSLKSADTELAIEKKEYSDLTVAEKKITKGSPLFDITFGENTNFGDGKVTFTVPFDKGDKDASLLYVAHILDGKVNEEIECTYNDDGTVSFSTGHLSVYTMLYKEAKKTHFLESMSVEQFIVFGVIFAIAMSAILLAVFKKMKG